MKIFALIAALLFTIPAHAQTVQPGTAIASIQMTAGSTGVAAAEASDFTAVADVGGALGGTSFYFYDADDLHCYQAWFDVDNGSAAPTAISGCTLVEVDIAEDAADTAVALAARTALNVAPITTYFAITGATTHVIATSLVKGGATDGNIGDTGFSVSKTQGVGGKPIADAAVVPGALGWRICNASANASTWLAVGTYNDPETTGARIAPGVCLDCPSCTGQLLKNTRVSAQAGSNAYTVVQFKN